MTLRAYLFFCAIAAGCQAAPAPHSSTPPPSSSSEDQEEPRITEVRWEGAQDPSALLVVLLHGYGAPGDDLVPVAQELAGRTGGTVRYALPQSPMNYRGRSDLFAWWELPPRRAGPVDRGQQRPAGLAAARRWVIEWIEGQRMQGALTPARTIIAGFSQGAMLAADVALAWEAEPAAVVMLSGGPVFEQRWRDRAAERPLRWLITHGRRDRVLSFAAAERWSGELSEVGSEVRFVPDNQGHTVSASATLALYRFLQEELQRDAAALR